MRKSFLPLTFMLLSSGVSVAQVANINPVPQEVSKTGGSFNAPTSWRLLSDKARANSYAVAALSDCGIAISPKAKFNVTLGVVGDACVKKYVQRVPTKAESYYLEVGPKGVVVAARDERGLYYGVQSLRDMANKGKLEMSSIRDWPDVAYRGAIEGFYGQPWSHEHRLRQLDFYGHNKMNVYIYGPKDDPYHRDKWREAYPETEARQIQELNERAKLRGVNFYWAIHPGVDIRWNDEDRDRLVAKLEKMYALGIRSFAVFFDDIWGEGAKGEKQAALLNYVDEVFVKKHGDIAPLLLCPTEYNRAWSSDESPYLTALGGTLNKGIEVMWTGNSVVHTIDKEGMDWINQRIKRKGYIWFNFPVNDFVRDHLLLGPTYGNGLDIADEVSGFVSNPMQYAESSKIALYSIADFTWNMKHYQWERSWERAIENVLPSDAEALKVFASYNEDLGQNGHGFRRDESRSLKPIIERIDASLGGMLDTEALMALAGECKMLERACELLLTNEENPWLIKEMRPWLVQGKLVAKYGKLSVDAALMASYPELRDKAEGLQSFESLYREAKSLRRQMYENEIDKQQLHFYQTGTKLGTLRLMPVADRLFAFAVDSYNRAKGTSLQPVGAYAPFSIESDVPQLRQQPISMYGSEVKITPSNEVIKWQAGGKFMVKADREVTLQGMDFNFDVPGVAAKFQLDCQLPNGSWKKIGILHYKDNDPVIHTTDELSGLTIRAFRLTNVSGGEVQTYFRHFKFNIR